MQYELFENTPLGQIALEEVFRAYYDCRRNKRRTSNAISFELDFERELIRLWRDINSGDYKIGRSIAFVVNKPVQREIFAADFRDRVVHHLVISKINSLFEELFIADSYSCRVGKGTLHGAKELNNHIVVCSECYTRDCYILKLDIRSFFMSIDKTILYQMLHEFIDDNYHLPDKPILLRLIKQIVFNNPEDNCIIKGRRADWNGLPCHKSLFWSARNCGLPIGNLTSQIFANFYLDKLDKYITEELGFRHYVRYVDDFVLVHQDKEELLAARQKIDSFLRLRLKLNLHPLKFYLQHYSKGVKFIGAVIKPNRIYIGNRSKGNLYDKVHKMIAQMSHSLQDTFSGLNKLMACVNSYIGLMRHYNTYRLRCRILQKIDQTFLGEALELDPKASKLVVHKLFRPLEQKKSQLRRQKQGRRRRNRILLMNKTKRKGVKNGNV